jgi:predicted transcriptional regulator
MVDWNNPKSLKRAIAKMGISLGVFADRAGVSRSQIYRLVDGQFRPQFETQRRIEAAIEGRTVPNRRRKARAAAMSDGAKAA